MLNMMSCKLKKVISIFALAAFLIGPMGYVMQSTAIASPVYASEYASRHNDRDYRDWKDKNKDKGHSTGEVITGVIVGGVIGAIIAKNT